MENYYFTFGQTHHTTSGVAMKDYWVLVVANSWSEARELFVEHFTKAEMPTQSTWALQYTEPFFLKEYFPNGEYCKIIADL